MPFDTINNQWKLSPLMEKLKAERESAAELQKRKHDDWDDNYLLYRNKVKINRLTQRQAVNIPLMKETIKTLLSKIDDAPNVEWKERNGDMQKELYFQEMWNQHVKNKKVELVDVLDKKNVLLSGFSVRKLNINESGVDPSVLDTYDSLIDPLMNPWDIESARFIIHRNIFRSVRDILADDKYSKKGKDELKIWADTVEGISASTTNKEEYEAKMERLRAMGVDHSQFSLYAGGDRLINLTEHFSKIWNKKTKKFEKRVVTYAEDTIELSNMTLNEAIGVDFWPFVYWSEDPETNDVYPDSVADLVRTPNKVLNVWFSQLIENRTLKNFQMHWFLPSSNYQPQTYTPGPGVMLPAPPGDNINNVIKPVEVNGLDDTMLAIEKVTNIVERGTGATSIEKGQGEVGEQTLGEVQILVGKAQERTVGMTKFYRLAWTEYANKWCALMYANAPKVIKLSKENMKGEMFEKTLLKSDWQSEMGYEPIVRSSSEQEADDIKGIQKFMFILSQFPNNQALRKIAQKRMLESVDLTPEELNQVENDKQEEVAAQQQAQEGEVPQAQQTVQAVPPEQQQLLSEIEQLSTQLA